MWILNVIYYKKFKNKPYENLIFSFKKREKERHGFCKFETAYSWICVINWGGGSNILGNYCDKIIVFTDHL